MNIREEMKLFPRSTAEKIALHYIETNQSIREMADFYGIPKSTMSDWMKKFVDLLDYDLYYKVEKATQMHKRKMCMQWQGLDEYYMVDGAGSRD